MSLVTTKQLLLDAQKEGYAVGAFNVENMEMVQAVVTAAEELQAPVIMQTTPSTRSRLLLCKCKSSSRESICSGCAPP